MSDEKTPPPGKDLITFGPDLGDGVGRPYIRHHADHHMSVGYARPAQDGQPLVDGSSLVKLRPAGENLHEVETLYEPPKSAGSGPAKVTSDAYRSGWDSIFGKRPVGEA